MRAFPDRHQQRVSTIIMKVKLVVQNYISGMLMVILILAVLNSIALFSLGIKHALLFAVFAAMLNVIPFIGPFIGAVLPITYALLAKDSLWYPFGVFLAFYVIQLAESNFFTPKIVGGKVSMNPFNDNYSPVCWKFHLGSGRHDIVYSWHGHAQGDL
jgi:predicted PurR-regulated permease PerM